MHCCSHPAGWANLPFFSALGEQGKFKKSEPVAWIPLHLNCAWGSPGTAEETCSCFKYSSNIKNSQCKHWFFFFFTAPSKITYFTSSLLPHVSWAIFLALGNEGQPCNLSKRKPGTVVSPKTYKEVTTEPLHLSGSREREYMALLLSTGTQPGRLGRKAAGARMTYAPCGLPVLAYNSDYQVSSLLSFLFMAGGTKPLSGLG